MAWEDTATGVAASSVIAFIMLCIPVSIVAIYFTRRALKKRKMAKYAETKRKEREARLNLALREPNNDGGGSLAQSDLPPHKMAHYRPKIFGEDALGFKNNEQSDRRGKNMSVIYVNDKNKDGENNNNNNADLNFNQTNGFIVKGYMQSSSTKSTTADNNRLSSPNGGPTALVYDGSTIHYETPEGTSRTRSQVIRHNVEMGSDGKLLVTKAEQHDVTQALGSVAEPSVEDWGQQLAVETGEAPIDDVPSAADFDFMGSRVESLTQDSNFQEERLDVGDVSHAATSVESQVHHVTRTVTTEEEATTSVAMHDDVPYTTTPSAAGETWPVNLRPVRGRAEDVTHAASYVAQHQEEIQRSVRFSREGESAVIYPETRPVSELINAAQHGGFIGAEGSSFRNYGAAASDGRRSLGGLSEHQRNVSERVHHRQRVMSEDTSSALLPPPPPPPAAPLGQDAIEDSEGDPLYSTVMKTASTASENYKVIKRDHRGHSPVPGWMTQHGPVEQQQQQQQLSPFSTDPTGNNLPTIRVDRPGAADDPRESVFSPLPPFPPSPAFDPRRSPMTDPSPPPSLPPPFNERNPLAPETFPKDDDYNAIFGVNQIDFSDDDDDDGDDYYGNKNNVDTDTDDSGRDIVGDRGRNRPGKVRIPDRFAAYAVSGAQGFQRKAGEWLGKKVSFGSKR